MGANLDLDDWFDVTAGVLSAPLLEFPVVELGAQVAATFELATLGWEWSVASGRAGNVALRGGEGFTAEVEALHANPAEMAQHPLLRWFVATGDPTAQTVGRVPESICSRADRAWFTEMAPVGMEHQLSIPCWLAGASYGAFVLGRSGEDFDDAELALARRVQRLRSGRATQVRAAGCGGTGVLGGAVQVGLTATETAVLVLLVRGYTATRIGHTLGSSPRTVHKHLEHIYRKLGVSDRLVAARVAIELGLVAEDRALVQR